MKTIKEKARIAWERDVTVDIVALGGQAAVCKPRRCKVIAYGADHQHEQGILTLGTSADSEVWFPFHRIVDITFVEDKKATPPSTNERDPFADPIGDKLRKASRNSELIAVLYRDKTAITGIPEGIKWVPNTVKVKSFLLNEKWYSTTDVTDVVELEDWIRTDERVGVRFT